MFPIVSLLMHETRTHQQNGTGHDYEPTRKLYQTRTRLHTHTHTHQTAQIRSARAMVLFIKDFTAIATHHRSRNNETCTCKHTGRRNPQDEYEGQCTEEYRQGKEKCSHFDFFFLTLYFGCRGKSSNEKNSRNPNPEEMN